MKTTKFVSQIIPLLLGLAASNLQPVTCLAQGTIFTYQGRLNDGASLAGGIYDLRFTIFDSLAGGSTVGGPVTNTAASLSNGLFTVTLDFGNVFDGSARWLEIGVRTNGGGAFTTLTPRQQLTATPYAITAGDVTGANVARLNVPNTAAQATGHPIVTSGFVTSAVVDNGGSGYLNAPSVSVLGTGSGAIVTSTISNGVVVSLAVQNAGSGYSNTTTLTIGAPPPNNFQVFVTSNFFPNVNVFSNPANVFVGDGSGLSGLWRLGGNAGTTSSNFLGTIDNQPLQLRVNGIRGLRLEPNLNAASRSNMVNVIGGSPDNFIAAGIYAATISGGGSANYGGFGSSPNSVAADFGTIGGGYFNRIVQSNAAYSTISGGQQNQIIKAFDSTIAGGDGNRIDGQSAPFGGGASTIGGGLGNTIGVTNFGASGIVFEGGHVIAGGNGNRIGTNLVNSTIAGGGANSIQASSATIGGGNNNLIQNTGLNSVIAGGQLNTNSGQYAMVPGGYQNLAAGDYSLAAGRRAKANHDGAFVWADSQNSDFASTATNQFLIRALGGVGIGTASPQGELHVNGSTVLQGLVAPSAVAATNLLNIGSGVTANGFRNGISFYEGATASAMSFGYDGVGGASQNALRIYHTTGSPLFTFQANGNLGIGTTNPLTVLHAVDTGDAQISIQSGDTNGHRWALQSSGVSGNIALDASFQIVDRTLNKPRLYIGTNGNVGLGTTVSDVPLTIRATGSAIEWLTLTSTNDTSRWQLNEFGGGFNIAQSSVADGRLFLANNGNAGIGTLNPTNKLHVAGGVSATAFVNTSDRNAKENFRSVAPRNVLDKLAALPIMTWNYKEMRDGRHMGPTAQDFHAAFGLGGSDRTITTVDPDGVALAAIQGLNEKLETENHTAEVRIRRLEAENVELKQRLEKLELLINPQK